MASFNPKKNLRLEIILYILIAFLPSLIILFFSVDHIQQALQNELIQRTNAAQQTVLAHLENSIYDFKSSVGNHSKKDIVLELLSMGDTSGGSALKILNRLRESANVSKVAIYNNQGLMLASTDNDDELQTIDLNLLSKIEAKKNKDTIPILINFRKVRKRGFIIDAFAPVAMSADSNFLGVLNETIIIDRAYIEGLKRLTDLEVCLFNKQGNPVLSTSSKMPVVKSFSNNINQLSSTINNIPYHIVQSSLIDESGELIGSIGLLGSKKIIEQNLMQIRWILIITLFGIIMFCVGIAFYSTKNVVNPLFEVVEALRKIAKGDFSKKVEIKRQNEIGELASACNEMSNKLDQSIKEIEASEQRYHNLIEFAEVGIVVASNNQIIQVNKRAEEIYGYYKNELIGKAPRILSSDKYSKQHQKFFNKAVKNGKPKNMFIEEEGVRKDGSIVPLEISYSLSQSAENERYNIIAIMRDITERKKMQQQLLQSEKLKSLGELAGGVAHDFNNVLAAILGRAQLLKKQFSPPPGKKEERKSMIDLIKSLEIIERASADGAETVRRIQEFSRKRSDDREFTHVDINKLLENSLEFTAVRWKDDAELKGIRISIEKEFSQLPMTSGSASELREVFTNIINNAVDAMPLGGKIHIKTSTENNHISIAIKDIGIGIPEDIKNRIFDPFFTTKGVQSTGLGMSTSYGIINRHKGTILVDSVEGEGTTFTIEIPVSISTLRIEEKTKPILKEERKATILVVDDEDEVRDLLADILTENGHQVETASDGSEGIELFKKNAFDLVFTDLGMPGMSGWQVAETIKTINDKTPVAIITGWNVELKESEMRERGVNLIAQKPFQMNQILNLVQEGMEIRERYEAA